MDSGPVHDSTIRGGRVGVFQFGPFQMIWSYLKVNCLEHWNQGLYLDGKDDYILLDDIPTLKMEERYGIIWAASRQNLSSGFQQSVIQTSLLSYRDQLGK